MQASIEQFAWLERTASILVSTREIHQCGCCMTFVEPSLGAVCKGCGAVMTDMRRREDE